METLAIKKQPFHVFFKKTQQEKDVSLHVIIDLQSSHMLEEIKHEQ